jgi:hypothetical protein
MTRSKGTPSNPMAQSQGTPSNPAAEHDQSVLQSALAAEHAAIYGYGVVGAYLTGTLEQAAQQDWAVHQVAMDTLVSRLTSAGAQPMAAQDAYQLPFAVRSRTAAVALAAFLEGRVAEAYMGLVALDDPGLRAWGAQQVRASALRATFWSGRTAAFPGLPGPAGTAAFARPSAAP